MRDATQHDQKQFLSVKGAANYIKRHRSTLDKWRAENSVLPFYQDSKKILYSTDDLDDYLQSCRIEPVAYGYKSNLNDLEVTIPNRPAQLGGQL